MKAKLAVFSILAPAEKSSVILSRDKGANSLTIGCGMLFLLLLMPHFHVRAQQQGLFTQYMFNLLAINPAYAGYSGGGEALDMRGMARQQWIGIDGAPSTQTISAQSPIRKKNMGVGLQISHDQVGASREVSTNFIYAYHIPITGRRTFMGNRFIGVSKLSLGLQAGVTYFSRNFSQVPTNSRGMGADPAFSRNDISTPLFNLGVGAYYYNDKFYISLSTPRLLENLQARGSKQLQHIFFSTGALFDISPSLTLKPTMLVKMVSGAPLQVDLATNLLIKQILWVGVSWRSLASVNILVEYNITKRLRVGYAYDIVTTTINQVSNHTHELMVGYRVPLGEIKVLNPRCF